MAHALARRRHGPRRWRASDAVILRCRGPRLLRRRRRRRDATSSAVASGATSRPRPTSSTSGIRTFTHRRTSPSSRPCTAPSPAAASAPDADGDYIVAGETRPSSCSKYANIGLTPDLGVSTLLPAAIGQRRALQLLLQDRTLSAARGARVGTGRRGAAARGGRRARRGGRALLARQRNGRLRAGQAPRPRRCATDRSTTTSPTRRPRSARVRHRRVEGARRGLRRGIPQEPRLTKRPPKSRVLGERTRRRRG